MEMPMKWIWLPKSQYPKNQTTVYSGFKNKTNGNYTVAEFKKTYSFSKKVSSMKLIFSGDSVVVMPGNVVSEVTGDAVYDSGTGLLTVTGDFAISGFYDD